MAVKAIAQKEAKVLRKKYPDVTVNVRQITRGNWGIRLSTKGKRDKWVPGSHVSHTGKVVCPSKPKRRRR